jgi:hypothetical protein
MQHWTPCCNINIFFFCFFFFIENLSFSVYIILLVLRRTICLGSWGVGTGAWLARIASTLDLGAVMRVSWIHFEAPLCYLLVVKILCLYIRRKSGMEWHSGKQKSRTNMHTCVQRTVQSCVFSCALKQLTYTMSTYCVPQRPRKCSRCYVHSLRVDLPVVYVRPQGLKARQPCESLRRSIRATASSCPANRLCRFTLRAGAPKPAAYD